MKYKKILNTTLPEAPLKTLGIFLSVLGILLVRASYDCRHPLPVSIIGSLVFVQGILGIIISEKLNRRIIAWWIDLPLWVYRIWGMGMVAAGTLCVLSK
ncbi:MAG: hypothetical protein ABII23_00245 [bacterium]